MVLYSTRIAENRRLLYFWGDRLTWDNLIVKNRKAFKNVYVFDPYVNHHYYPKEIKLITSEQTAKRLTNIRLEKSIVFINGNSKDVNNLLGNSWLWCEITILNVELGTIIYGLKKGIKVLEPSSRRNIRYLSKYK